MSMSASLTRLMRWPNSVTSSSAVSWSIVWVSVTGHAHLEQGFDQVGAALGHAVGEFLDGDRLGHDDVADLLGRRAGFHVVALFLLAGAAQRGERAGAAVVLVAERAGDGELAALAMVVAAAAARTGRLGALGRGRMAAGRRAVRSSSSSAGGGGVGLGRAAAARLRFLLRRSRGASSAALPRPCDSLRRGGARPRSARRLAVLLAAARFLERGEPRFLGLAQQLRLKLLAAGDVVLRRRLARLRARAPRAWARASGASAAGLGRLAGGASPGRPRMRRFLTSTTTVFERPWLKLCLTLPVSTVRLRPSGGRVPSFGFSVWSAILFLRQIRQSSRCRRRVRRPLALDRGQ